MKKCNLTLKWAHLPIEWAFAWMNSFTKVAQFQWSSGKTKTSYGAEIDPRDLWPKWPLTQKGPKKVNFGYVTYIHTSIQTYRKWCIRAHRTYAQVGSKKRDFFRNFTIRAFALYSMVDGPSDELKLGPTRKKTWVFSVFSFFPPTLWNPFCMFFFLLKSTQHDFPFTLSFNTNQIKNFVFHFCMCDCMMMETLNINQKVL